MPKTHRIVEWLTHQELLTYCSTHKAIPEPMPCSPDPQGRCKYSVGTQGRPRCPGDSTARRQTRLRTESDMNEALQVALKKNAALTGLPA